ncbi:MAG: VCBS repeat-containing protein, partial [Pseudomonadota bacterium]|nr:VCBS repeat-containing protein [Pseudomonadota bacterium]
TMGDDGVAWGPGFVSASPVFSGEDIDGDGRADLAVIDVEPDGTSDIAYQVFFGGEAETRCPLFTTSGYFAAPIGDGDGDGITETAWRGDGEVWILSGGAIRDACEGWIEDHAVGLLDVPEGGGPLIPGIRLGDWDGDGVEEWMTYRNTSLDPGDEVLWVFSADAAVSGAFSTDDALGSWVVPPGANTLTRPKVLDLDGDGIDELLVSEGDYRAHVIRGGTPFSFGADLPAHHLRYAGNVCVSSPCSGDFDGDGFEDLLAREGNQEDGGSSAWIIYGFEVPWDDASRW